MLEAAALYIELGQSVHCGHTVLNKAAVGFGVDAQCGQSRDHLGQRFTGNTLGASEGAVLGLDTGQPGQCLIHSGGNCGIAAIVRCQCLQGHTGHIRITDRTSQCPATAGKLCVQNCLHQLFTGHIPSGDLVIMGIKGDQRPNSTVDALITDVIHIIQTGEQVVSTHIGHIIADGCQCYDHAGVIGGLGCMEPSAFVNVVLDIFDSCFVEAVGHFPSGTDEADYPPLTVGRADTRCGQTCQIIAGGLVDVRDIRACQLQQFQRFLSSFQHRQILNQCFLCIGQSIISYTGSVDLIFAIQRNCTNGCDLFFHSVGSSFILQFCQFLFRCGQNIIIANQLFLRVGQCVISLPCSDNLLFAVQGNRANSCDLFFHCLGRCLIRFVCNQLCVFGFCIGQFFKGFLADQCLLCIGQCVIGSPSFLNGSLAVQGHGVDGIDLSSYCIGCILVGLFLLQLSKLCFRVGQLGIVGNGSLLILRQCIISISGSGDGSFAVQSNLTNCVDQIDDILHLFASFVRQNIQNDAAGSGNNVIGILYTLLTRNSQNVLTCSQCRELHLQLARCIRGSQLGPGGHITGGQCICLHIVDIPNRFHRGICTAVTHVSTGTVYIQRNLSGFQSGGDNRIFTNYNIVEHTAGVGIESPTGKVANRHDIAVTEHNTVCGNAPAIRIRRIAVVVVVIQIHAHVPEFFHEDRTCRAAYREQIGADQIIVIEITLACVLRFHAALEDFRCVDVQMEHGRLSIPFICFCQLIFIQPVQRQIKIRYIQFLQRSNCSAFGLDKLRIVGNREVNSSLTIRILILHNGNGTGCIHTACGSRNGSISLCVGSNGTIYNCGNTFIGRCPGYRLIRCVIR